MGEPDCNVRLSPAAAGRCSPLMVWPGAELKEMFWVWMTRLVGRECQHCSPSSATPPTWLSCSSCRLSRSAPCSRTWLVGM